MSKGYMRSAASTLTLLRARLNGAPNVASEQCSATARKLDGRALTAFALLGTMLVASTPAYAQSGGGGDLTSFLQNLVNLLTGTVGKSIAVLAIAITGIGWMLGAASARTAGAVIVGVMLVFSASWIVGQIVGS